MFIASKSGAGIFAIAAATALVLTGCAGDSGTTTTQTGGGESSGGGGDAGFVNVSLPQHVWSEAIEKRYQAFEEETGITVNFVKFGEAQLSDQYNVKLNTGSSDFDVMMYRPLQEGKLFIQNEWLLDITDEVNSSADYNWSDFQAGPVEAVTGEDGRIYGVPLVTERQVLYYNTRILAEAGVEVPTTMAELEAAVAATHNPPEVYGFVARGERSAAVTQFSSFLYSFGGDWDNGAGAATLDTPEALEAYSFYAGLLENYGPVGTVDMNWPQALPVFAQASAAFYTDADSLYANFTDPEKSVVMDEIGFAVFPEGPAGSKPYNVPSWAVGINAFSQNQENAWKFIEWATSPERSLDIQQDGIPLARTSVWESPEGTAGFPAQLVDVINKSAEIGIGYDRPLVVAVGEARSAVGAPISIGIEGGDISAALRQAQAEYQALLDEEAG